MDAEPLAFWSGLVACETGKPWPELNSVLDCSSGHHGGAKAGAKQRLVGRQALGDLDRKLTLNSNRQWPLAAR